MLKTIFYPFDRTWGSRLRTLGIALLIGLMGYGLIRSGQAATHTATSEAETASLAGVATTEADSRASGGSAVRFGSAAATPSLDDGFDGTSLADYWTFGNPGTTSGITLANGAATFTVGANNDQWINVDKAPRLLKTAPSGGDWTIETRLSGNTGTATSLAGLVVYKDAANYLNWAQVANSSLEGSGIINNQFTETFTSMASKFQYLRIRKVGTTYMLDGSVNGAVWNNANSWTDTSGALNGARVGLLTKNWGNSAYTITIDYYREYVRDTMPSALAGIAGTSQVAKQTGYDALNDTRVARFCGTDLGEMFRWDGKMYTVFGDTNRCDGGSWPSNVMSNTSDTDPSDGIKYDGWVGGGSELFPEEPGNVTAIPSDGIGIGSNAYIYYMNINNWSPPAPTKWTCTSSSIASASSGNPAAWTKRQSTINWAGDSNFALVAAHQIGDEVYVWGTTCGRFGSVKLMKVPAGSILDKSAYRYMSGYDSDGTPQWSASEAAAITVAGGPAGELSVIYNKWLGRYVMTYLDERKGAIVIREAASPWGSWSAPRVIAKAADYPQLYGGFMDESYLGNDGQTIYWMLSMFGPYNTYLMKTTLTK